MARRYSLDAKVNALNQLEDNGGDVLLTSQWLDIPANTIRYWRENEAALRHSHRQRQQMQMTRLRANLQLQMLERAQTVLGLMNPETLAGAPVNQLVSALGSLVSHALKLEEANEHSDEPQEQTIRFEYYYGGQLHLAPPWAGGGEAQPDALQGRRLREALGQNGTGQNAAAGKRARRADA